MALQDIYLQAMEASIQNAEQWLKDAIILVGNKSFTHARALQNFSGEECAKALGCWLVGTGLIPKNHPSVQIRKSGGIFKSHNLKNKLSLLLGALSMLPEITPGAVIGILIVAEAAGKWGTDKRMEWMYVDIIQSNDGLQVSNPLEIDTGDVNAGLNLVSHKIKFLKRLIKGIDTEAIVALKKELSDFFPNDV